MSDETKYCVWCESYHPAEQDCFMAIGSSSLAPSPGSVVNVKNNMNWKDSTSYVRNDKDRKPTAWTTEIAGLRITITSGHIYYPGKWVMHCYEVGMDTVPVNAVSAETAQRMAVEMVREKVEVWHEALQASNEKGQP